MEGEKITLGDGSLTGGDSEPPTMIESESDSDTRAPSDSGEASKVPKAKAKAKPENLDRVKTKPKAKRIPSDVRTCKHNPYTHFPKDPDCAICRAFKTQRARCKSCPAERPDGLSEPFAFADAITADHAILNEDDESRDKDRVVCVIQDQFTHWLQAYASHSKSSEETAKAVKRFLGPQTKAKHAYTDNSKEFIKAFKDMDITHDTSTPHRPSTNGVAERAVRRVKEGTACTLVQSGLDEVWWFMLCHVTVT